MSPFARNVIMSASLAAVILGVLTWLEVRQ